MSNCRHSYKQFRGVVHFKRADRGDTSWWCPDCGLFWWNDDRNSMGPRVVRKGILQHQPGYRILVRAP